MKPELRSIPFIVAAALFVPPAVSGEGAAASFSIEQFQVPGKAKQLIQNVLERYEGRSRLNTMSLVTCAYVVRDGKGPKCVSNPRKKKLYSLEKKFGENLKDVRSLTVITMPVAENGIGILQYDYDTPDKETDQWLYLPEIGQVKRVASSDDAPKKGSLFGSEFSMEDIERAKVEDYRFEVVGAESFAGRSVVLIAQLPTAERASRTNYSKRVQWVDPDRLLVLKTEYFDWNNTLTKVSYVADMKQIDDIWTVTKTVMNNVLTERISVMAFDNVRYNDDVGDELFVQRVLNDPVFRKNKLSSLRFFGANG